MNELRVTYFYNWLIRLSLSKPLKEISQMDLAHQRKNCWYYLKVMHQAGLVDLALAMKISRMAVHKHLSSLQQRGLVEAIENRGHVGRPKMIY